MSGGEIIRADERTPVQRALEAAAQKRFQEEWERRAKDAAAILPQGWDVHVEQSPVDGRFTARVEFRVTPAVAHPFEAIDATVAYYRALLRDPRGRIVVPGR